MTSNPLAALLSPVVDLVWAKLEPLLDQKLDELSDKVLALLPVLAASAAKSVLSDIPGGSTVVDIAEQVRDTVNEATPVGIHIPSLAELGELFNRVTH